jgi:hypothetical protein
VPALYWPAAHWVHPLLPRYSPGTQSLVSHAVCFVVGVSPSGHVLHAATFDEAEYVAAGQAVHWVAPELFPWSVIYPPPQAIHSVAIFDTSEYVPAAHGVQREAPPLEPVFVTEPASHEGQFGDTATSDAEEYLPETHAMHVLAPTSGPVFVRDPALHTVHESTFDATAYWPATHLVQPEAPSAAPVLVSEPAGHEMHTVSEPTLLLKLPA